jgi:hypothetical protein
MNLKVPHFKFLDFQLWFWLNCSKTFKTELNLESYSTSTYTTYCLRLEIVISTTLPDKNLLCCTSAEGDDLSNIYHFLDQSQKVQHGQHRNCPVERTPNKRWVWFSTMVSNFGVHSSLAHKVECLYPHLLYVG